MDDVPVLRPCCRSCARCASPSAFTKLTKLVASQNASAASLRSCVNIVSQANSRCTRTIIDLPRNFRGE
ncbi:hypothetical protein EVAR_85058_1 [Eumeta japonica]|uniref:Uncharacterized protein n=1 Tax=Eumeta variegata TaxID=151549 RepID=A0A4C1XBL5_EUMVA|nr:hypothetical protein EVAR_85058_1 [Eumeta japonica]